MLLSAARLQGQGFIEFSGYYSLTPHSGDSFGNWTRTGNLMVDVSPERAPHGLRLDLDGPGAGSLTIVAPAAAQFNTWFETHIVGDGSMTYNWGGLPVVLEGAGDYTTFSGANLKPGDTFGWELRAGPGSHVSVELIPEPPAGILLLFGAGLLVSWRAAQRGRPRNGASIDWGKRSCPAHLPGPPSSRP